MNGLFPRRSLHRVLWVRMIPTREQVIELKRCFSACRRAYNWALAKVKNENAAPNTIELMYRQRLQWASSRYAGRHVFETEEPGTSKTCTSCGFWHANLQLNDKTFVCPKCQLSVDRDIAGARNNFFVAYGNAVGIGWDGSSK